jgi:hypothetical protein
VRVVALVAYTGVVLSCGGRPQASSPPPPRASAPVPVALLDAGRDAPARPPLPFQLEQREVRDPGYALGLAREWKVCVLDAMRVRDLRCGKELLSESESLPSYGVSDECRALVTSVATTCTHDVKERINAALPSGADVTACRDGADDAACGRITERVTSPLFANRGGVGCTACGRQAKDFSFAAKSPEPVPAADSLPFAQVEIDAIYERLDAGLGAMAVRRCEHAFRPHDCFELEDLLRVHAAHPDAAKWEQKLARMQPKLDELTWAGIEPRGCIRQRDDEDERQCALLRNYLASFPAGRHAADAGAALARSAPARAARVRTEEIEGCRRSCAAPPRDWGMGPGPAHCARVLGRACR